LFLISGFKIQNSWFFLFCSFFVPSKRRPQACHHGFHEDNSIEFHRKDPVLLWPYEELKRVKRSHIRNNQICNLRVI